MATIKSPRFVPEESVLVPTTEVSDEDWPGYVLSDAIVYRPDGVTMANALLIDQEGPFTVRGRLEIDDDDEEEVKNLIDPSVRTIDIEIKDSKVYSIGYYPEAVVWVSGKAGWFEINPHPSYAKIYKDMCDVSQLDYVLAKIYLEEDGSLKSHKADPTLTDIKEVMLQYAIAIGDGITYDETVDRVLRLGPALLSHMKSSSMAWKQTSIYPWLVRELKNKERSNRSSSRSTSQPPASAAAAAAVSSPRRGTPDHTPVESPLAKQPLSQTLALRVSTASASASGQRAAAATPPIPDDLASRLPDPLGTGPLTEAEEDAVFQMYAEPYLAIANRMRSRSLTSGALNQAVYKHFRIVKYKTCTMFSAYFAKRLLESLDAAWDGWDGSKLVQQLASNDNLQYLPSSNEFLRDLPGQLVVRRRIAFAERSSRSRQSSQDAHRKLTGGKSAGLRPPETGKKRPHSASLGDDIPYDAGSAAAAVARPAEPRPESRPRKMAKSSTPSSMVMPESESHDADVALGDADDDANVALGDADEEDSVLTYKSDVSVDNDSNDSDDSDDDNDRDDAQDSETVVAVHAVPLNVSTLPTGPNGTWNCPHPGCHFFVRNADGDEAQENIRSHLGTHEENTLSRVDLAISEGSRKHVSVNNLLAKIRALADARTGQVQDQPEGAPRPASAAVVTPRSILRRFLF